MSLVAVDVEVGCPVEVEAGCSAIVVVVVLVPLAAGAVVVEEGFEGEETPLVSLGVALPFESISFAVMQSYNSKQ
jgi:hypothetical protein